MVASADEGTALFFRDLFATRFFRTYTSDDPVGVELCAAFKNVIAIAVGISYGMASATTPRPCSSPAGSPR